MTDHTYWESLLESWNAVSRLQEGSGEPPVYLHVRTGYGKGIKRFTETILTITEGGADPAHTALYLENFVRGMSLPANIQLWMELPETDVAAEKAGLLRTAEACGRWCARRLFTESDPIRKAGYTVLQTLSSLVMDSLQNYPKAMANAFSHAALDEALQELSTTILRETGNEGLR